MTREGGHSIPGALLSPGTWMTVADVMTRPVVSVTPSTPAIDARAFARRRGVHHLLVTESGSILGILCVCDLWSAQALDPVAAYMVREIETISRRECLSAAGRLMRHRSIGCLPVEDGGRIAGVVTRGDLARAGIPIESTGPVCSNCKSHHHVAPNDLVMRVHLCLECLDRACPPSADEEAYIDFGGGD